MAKKATVIVMTAAPLLPSLRACDVKTRYVAN